MYYNKENEFIDWSCGVSDARFPFFRHMPKVPYPIGFKEEVPDKYQHLLPEDDIYDHELKEDDMRITQEDLETH